MEDFGPLLWILIAGGAMAYSAMSNAKKQAQKAKKHPHQEAWPTNTAQEAATTGPDARETRQFTSPEPEPWSFDREYEEGNVSEIHSLEVPEPAAAQPKRGKTAPRQPESRHQSPVALKAAKHAEEEAMDCTEEAPGEIAEEFDLRKAVIYSEILKPKFEE